MLLSIRTDMFVSTCGLGPDGTKFAVASGAKCVSVCYFDPMEQWCVGPGVSVCVCLGGEVGGWVRLGLLLFNGKKVRLINRDALMGQIASRFACTHTCVRLIHSAVRHAHMIFKPNLDILMATEIHIDRITLYA